MVDVSPKHLIAKLNEGSQKAVEGAAGLCLSRTNYNIEIEHWLVKLLEIPNSDLHAICNHFSVDTSRLMTQLNTEIDSFKTGNARTPALSPSFVDLIKEAWVVCSVTSGESQIRTGHVLAALLNDEALSRSSAAMVDELSKLPAPQLLNELAAITAESGESAAAKKIKSEPAGGGSRKVSGPTDTPSLDQFTINLTERAESGSIDPVLGRDPEIRQIIDILMRRRQNNPILTGEPGVGKTAVAEGFALRLAAGDVPPALEGVTLRSLDMGLLQAGAGIKGEFENRLKSVIDEVKSSPTPIILFIDEAHTMIGAGGAAGGADAANLLKPALARGELRTIAATTWTEYKKYFEKDAALARRFQVVKVEEPSIESAIDMMRGLTQTLEKHHRIRILNEAVVDAVNLSSRYIAGRLLPDKSVSLLDTTCARIRLSQAATPPSVEDCQRRIEQLKVSIGILERELTTGGDHDEELQLKREELAASEVEYANLQKQWEQELELVGKIGEIRDKLEGTASSEADEAADDADTAEEGGEVAEPAEPLTEAEAESLKQELLKIEEELRTVQGEDPLVQPVVNSAAVAETVAAWTGIPVGRMVADEIQTVLNLKEMMEKSIIGQSHALDLISQRIRTSRANLNDPNTPIGVFLLAGTSGVGKTETAITLAELLYGGEQNMTTINMTEFKEEHKISQLIGSPKGYVGYGTGGVLTEAVRRKPYSVILLDELEKAHASFQDLFYQVFDKGKMNDSDGVEIDFKNTVILMTTNAGTDAIKALCSDPDTIPEPEAFSEAIFDEMLKDRSQGGGGFAPAFLGRLQIIPYYPLAPHVLEKIIGLKLGKVGRRVKEHYGGTFSYTPEVTQTILERCTEVDTGARNIDHIVSRTILPQLSAEFLQRMADGNEISGVEIKMADDGSFAYDLS